MKKASYRLLAMAIVCIAITSAGCNKLLDYVNNEGGGTSASRYRIKSIKGFGVDDTAKLTLLYNKYGNPVHMEATPYTTGRSNADFKYDNKQRLTERITYYSENSGYELYVKYKYDASGLPVGDTTFYFGQYNANGPLTAFSSIYTAYTLDSYGRIIKTAHQVLYPNNSYYENFYTYDSKGNLTQLAPVILYDDKVSYLRTSGIFMLIEKNYSLNNPFVADSYSHARLPTAVSNNEPYAHFTFLGASIPSHNLVIEYEKQ